MARITVIPERLDDLARQMTRAASELRDLEGRLGRALGGLDWQARQQANVEGQVHAARRQASALADEAGRLARFLSDRAAAFRQADSQGAEALGATMQAYIKAARSILPQLGTVLNYMGAGRVATQKFLDLLGIRRYGPLAPWLKIGVLDQRTRLGKAVGKMGVLAGMAGDIITADEINEKTIGVAVIRNLGEYAIGTAFPPFAIALAGNAIIQMTGTGIVMASRATIPLVATSEAMAADLDTSTDRLEQAFQRVDLGRITKGISEIVYDATIGPRLNTIKAAWQEPNITNLTRLAVALHPQGTVMYTHQEAQTIWDDVEGLAGDVFDFVEGVPDLGFSLIGHATVMGAANLSKVTDILPLPDEWQHTVQQSCEAFIDWSVSHPVTVDSLASATVATGSPFSLIGYSPGVSRANSIQFTPVLAAA